MVDPLVIGRVLHLELRGRAEARAIHDGEDGTEPERVRARHAALAERTGWRVLRHSVRELEEVLDLLIDVLLKKLPCRESRRFWALRYDTPRIVAL